MSATAITRLPERRSTDRAALNALLDEVIVGHVGIVRDGMPVVIPTLIVRDGDRVLLHGSTGSAWMRATLTQTTVCLAVTSLDALVVARSAFESSVRYRSAVLFGRCQSLDSDERRHALNRITDQLIPGRLAEVRRPAVKEVAATMVLAFPITEWSLKESHGWPEDPDEDVAGDAWAGVLPVVTRWGGPVAAPDLRDGIGVPASVRQLVGAAHSSPVAVE